MRFKISTSRLCTYGIGFTFFLVQMSQRISAKGKTPAWGLFLYRLINHFPFLSFLITPKTQLNETALIQNVVYCTLNGKLFRKGSALRI